MSPRMALSLPIRVVRHDAPQDAIPVDAVTANISSTRVVGAGMAAFVVAPVLLPAPGAVLPKLARH